MAIEQNKAVVRRDVDEIWTQGNAALIDELYTADAVDHNPLPGLQATGRALQKQTLQMLHTGFPDFQNHIDLMLAEGDKVAVSITIRGTHLGQFLQMPPTGKAATWTRMTIYRLENGQIAELWHVVDALGLIAQLGLLPGTVPA
ncbi:MAG: ester cyclase [Caldilineaceae bacterium]